MTPGLSLRWLMGVAAGVVAGAVLASGPRIMRAQVPKPAVKPDAADPKPAAPARNLLREVEALLPKPESLKPRPEEPIPDDPPPYEGAMIDIPYRVQPPDLIIVEVLEALPGRPIAGERLVRPDGTITLGFYGDVHVSGLTVEQIKEKVIVHLRKYLSDEQLGLVAEVLGPGDEAAANVAPNEKAAPAKDPKADHEIPPLPPDAPNPFHPAPRPEPPKSQASRPSPRVRVARFAQTAKPEPIRAPRFPVRDEAPQAGDGPQVPTRALPSPSRPADMPAPPPDLVPGDDPRTLVIAPKASDRVFVDIASYNSKVYFVLGDVTARGRFPSTGNETVLDALQFGGGLALTADPMAIRLVRPARGGKPAKVYPIDLDAIQNRGDATANLQLFPGDRLVIGRDATVEATVRLNRVSAPLNTMMNNALTFAHVLQNLDRLNSTERRKAVLKAWNDYWSKVIREGNAEEKRLGEEMRGLLDK